MGDRSSVRPGFFGWGQVLSHALMGDGLGPGHGSGFRLNRACRLRTGHGCRLGTGPLGEGQVIGWTEDNGLGPGPCFEGQALTDGIELCWVVSGPGPWMEGATWGQTLEVAAERLRERV